MALSITSRISDFRERMQAVEPVPQPPRTILVVDDDRGVRDFIERVLDDVGYSTVSVSNGPEALRVAAAISTIDMIVTDVMMPEMSGCELTRRLRVDNPAIKVLYITGYRDRLFDEKVMMWEDEAFIEKPCGIKALLEAVSLLWCHRLDGMPRTVEIGKSDQLSGAVRLPGSTSSVQPLAPLPGRRRLD
jgi:CheY-like chemotaxis protein